MMRILSQRNNFGASVKNTVFLPTDITMSQPKTNRSKCFKTGFFCLLMLLDFASASIKMFVLKVKYHYMQI